MKPQFQTKTLLLAVTMAAIFFWGAIEWHRSLWHPSPASADFVQDVRIIFGPSPIWVPLVFVVFAIGRKALTTRMVLLFAAAEALAVYYWRILYYL